MNRRTLLLTTAAMGALLSVGTAEAMDGSDVLKQLNRDSDQTLEIPEVIDAAAKLYQKLNKDGDLTLEHSETAGRLTDADWRAFNKDHDSTLELDEWLAIARMRFNAADMNHDGSLTVKELNTPAGQALVKMIVE